MLAQIAITPRPFPTRPSIDPAEFETLDDYRAAWDSWAAEWDLSMAERVILMDAIEEDLEAHRAADEAAALTIFFQECDAVRDMQTDCMFHTPYESYGSIHAWAEAENAGVGA